jgi:cytoskeletal protein RodZ
VKGRKRTSGKKPFHNKKEVKRKMAKETRKSWLFVILFMLLLISSAYASLVPIVNAAEPTVQDKTVDVLNDVVGINTEEYATVQSSQYDNNYRNLPQKEVYVTLVSDQGRVRASCSFVNNMLRQIYLSDYEGDLSVEQPATETAEMAKGFLQRYQNYAEDSFYGELASTLDGVDIDRNATKTAGNIKLEVLNWDQTIVDYVWTYTDENGIIAKSKNVILSYDRGQLKVFLNNWPLYTVVGTPKISSEEATAIAVEAFKNFSYEVDMGNGTEMVSGFKIAPKSLGHATLSYLNFPNQSLARKGDPFTLYPSWYVPLGFDKSYPGGVTGMTVSIWADTGEVSITGPMVVGMPSSNLNEEEKSAISAEALSPASAPFVAVAVFTVIGVVIGSARKPKFAGRKLFKKSWVALLCGVILFSVIVAAVPTAFADEHLPNSKARIYAALDGDPNYPAPGTSPPQLQDEKDAANWVCGEIASAFAASGYSTSNHCGSQTTANNVGIHAQNDQQSYDRVAVFHFGHKMSDNFVYADNTGNPITWQMIGGNTSLGKHKFVFIWVCSQAQAPHYGIPANWTHKSDMHSDGYTNPDCSGQCYIGFFNSSTIISGFHQTFNDTMTDPVKYFIKYFYDYALKIVPGSNYAVRDSLNKASLDFFGQTYTSSPFNQGYFAWYPGDQYHYHDYYYGRMRVFGDGSMWIFQPKITLTTNCGLSPTK